MVSLFQVQFMEVGPIVLSFQDLRVFLNQSPAEPLFSAVSQADLSWRVFGRMAVFQTPSRALQLQTHALGRCMSSISCAGQEATGPCGRRMASQAHTLH